MFGCVFAGTQDIQVVCIYTFNAILRVVQCPIRLRMFAEDEEGMQSEWEMDYGPRSTELMVFGSSTSLNASRRILGL
jgi:hypothetical protein